MAGSAADGRTNLGIAVAVHLLVGFLWLAAVSIWVGLSWGGLAGVVWLVSGGVLWCWAVSWMSEARDDALAVWGRSFLWWVSSFFAPVSLAGVLLRRWQVNAHVIERLNRLEARLASVETTLDALQRTPRERAPEAEPEPAPAPPPAAATPPRPAPTPAPAPVRRPAAETPPRVVRPPKPPSPPREIDWNALFGPRALAIAGGIVTVLGIVFFFALAVNRGWIGPEARVVLGTAASLLVFGAGLELRRRYGTLYAPVAAVGAGIAGGYATLVAATTLYELVPPGGALPIAAAIAALALAVSLAWRDELVAGIGLIGAIVAPALLIFDTGLTATGTAFVALVLAAAATVAVTYRWRYLLVVTAALAAPQAMVLFASRARPDASLVALSAVFCAIYLATGIAWQLRDRASALGATASGFLVGSAGFALYATLALFQGGSDLGRGIDLLAFGGAYALLGAAFLTRKEGRDIGSVLAALGLALGAVGVADVLSGGSLTYAWAAEAAALAWLALRLREPRFQVAALAYTALAFVHAFVIEAPLTRLFDASAHPGVGIPSLLAVAIAAGVVALCTSTWPAAAETEGVLAHLNGFFNALRSRQSELRIGGLGVAGLLTIEAASLGVLETYARWWPDDLASSFDHGQVALTGLWAAASVLALAAGLRRQGSALAYAGVSWLAVAVAKVVLYDGLRLPAELHAYACVEVAGALLVALVLVQALRPSLWGDAAVSYLTIGASIALAMYGTATLVDGHLWRIDLKGAAFLGLAALYGTVGAAFLPRPRHRNFSTVLWASAAALAMFAAALLVGGQWLAVVLAAGGATLAWLTRATGERRLQIAAIAYLAAAAVLTLGVHATVADLFSANEHPGAGVPSLVALIVATLAAALLCGAPARPPREELDAVLDLQQPRWRRLGTWLSAGLALYGLSLTILEAAERISGRNVITKFQNGHTAVSAVWGAIGLALLYVGLQRKHTALRLGGLALFGVSLAKLFVYDLSRLSSITRALSFLAVGAVLLLGGFFYQRLEDGVKRRERPVAP